jgi:guanine deaminase
MTHLAENRDEVRRVAELFPDAGSYTDVYARAGLLGERTLVAHAIHLHAEELALLAASGATVVHCPTANRALGSGRLPLERLREHDIPWVLGTDVGAGPSLSMWHVIAGFLATHAGKTETTAEEAFWHATWAGARALGLEAVGCLQPGHRADLAVFPRPAGAAGAEAIIRELAAATTAVPEPAALATWLDGELVHDAVGELGGVGD